MLLVIVILMVVCFVIWSIWWVISRRDGTEKFFVPEDISDDDNIRPIRALEPSYSPKKDALDGVSSQLTAVENQLQELQTTLYRFIEWFETTVIERTVQLRAVEASYTPERRDALDGVSSQLTAVENQLQELQKEFQAFIAGLEEIARERRAQLRASPPPSTSPKAETSILGDLAKVLLNVGVSVGGEIESTRYLKKQIDQLQTNIEKSFEKQIRELRTKIEELSSKLPDTNQEVDIPHHTGQGLESTKSSSGVMVFVTESGKKYHREGCRYLGELRTAVPLTLAKQNYNPCSVCAPQNEGNCPIIDNKK